MKTYQKEDITVTWESEKCIHSGVCARGLAAVFKPREKPWIQVDNASKEDIVNQVKKCPSGALGIK
ncbi:(4Fe-4S)-binding protein [Marinoscillum sp. MHG1-6]|uniref:(4Fe-4S)-binding protein n=1 Tax=Marinoscillum sp. MHG1-6 TaxID=2959627 RepID=UPI002157D9F4|nr:(4Fe-4S)-binding protein [Marinoscillum sp. MHG1-6]